MLTLKLYIVLIVIAQARVKFWIKSTRCSEDDKIAVISQTLEFYAKFHSFEMGGDILIGV